MKRFNFLFVAAVLLMASSFSMPTSAREATIYYPDGTALVVPLKTWRIVALPKGYNSKAYDAETNPKGKLPGWQGWPGYSAELEASGCLSDDLVLAAKVCPDQPYFTTLTIESASDEPEVPCGEGLVVGPTICEE